MFYLLLFLGLLVRFLLIPVPGFKADVAFWKGWGLAVADKGILWLANNTNYNYPPGFAYVLWLINKIYALFADPYDINQYWLDNNYFYLFLIKIITIIADIGIVWLILQIGKIMFKKSEIRNPKSEINIKAQSPNNQNDLRNLSLKNLNIGQILVLFYFLNPVAIFDGVIWGQVDQYGLFLFIVSVYFLIKNKPGWASVFFVISFLMKFQNIIFIPLFYLYILKKYSLGGLVRSAQISLLIFALITIPFWWTRQMASLIRLFTINANWFPWFSLNAFNLWWLAAGLEGLKVSDKTLVFGIMNAKQVGLFMFSFFYLISTLRVALAEKEKLLGEFLISLTLIVFIFFHLLTQSHERYLYPLLGLFLILYLVKKETNIKRLLIFFLLLSIGMFFNMYISAAMNYPDQVYWPFSANITRSFSLYISIYQIALFIYFIWQYFSGWIIKNKRYVAASLFFFIFGIILANTNYLLKKPISLTKISPIYQHQDYLEPVKNMTVESARGVFFWNRLSNNYYFYKQGIGSHADSVISYGLGGRFNRFKTDFGIDTEGAAEAKVFFIIEGDGRELFRSKSQGRFDFPGVADVSIKGVKILTLKIIKDGETNFGAHANWLEPVLIR